MRSPICCGEWWKPHCLGHLKLKLDNTLGTHTAGNSPDITRGWIECYFLLIARSLFLKSVFIATFDAKSKTLVKTMHREINKTGWSQRLMIFIVVVLNEGLPQYDRDPQYWEVLYFQGYCL